MFKNQWPVLIQKSISVGLCAKNRNSFITKRCTISAVEIRKPDGTFWKYLPWHYNFGCIPLVVRTKVFHSHACLNMAELYRSARKKPQLWQPFDIFFSIGTLSFVLKAGILKSAFYLFSISQFLGALNPFLPWPKGGTENSDLMLSKGAISFKRF